MATEAEYKSRIRQLITERDQALEDTRRNANAAQTSHEAYQELEQRFLELQATLELEREEHRRRVEDLARELSHSEPANDALIAVLEPFANAGRSIPTDAKPKVFYVPGTRNAKTFDLEDLRRAAQVLYPEEFDPRARR